MSFVVRLFGWLQSASRMGSATSRRRASRKRPRAKRTNRCLHLESLEGRQLLSTLVWDGNGGDGRNYVWSAWNNWNPAQVPQTGDALVFSGKYKLSNYNNLWLTVPQITVQTNGFNIDGNPITLGSGGVHFTGGTNCVIGLPMTLPSAGTPIEVSGSRLLYLTDVISGSGGLAKYGTGTAVLSGANSYTGSTTVVWGTLSLNNANALQQSTLDYNNYGGVLSFGSLTSATLGGLAGAQNLPLSNASGAAVALTVGANDQDTVYSGVLSGGGSLTKFGNGAFTLAGASSYTGTTAVNAGTLSVTGSLAGSTVIVNGGVLTGGGSVKTLKLNGGAVSPGAGIGTFTVTDGAILDRGVLNLQFDEAANTDQLVVSGGDVVLGGTLQLSAAETFHAGSKQVFALINNTGSGTTSGTFAGYAEGQKITLNGQRFEIHYQYDFNGDGRANDVVLMPTINVAPMPVADTYAVTADAVFAIGAPGLLANDTDPNGDPLTASLVHAPAHGNVDLSADGGFSYTPDADFLGVDDAMIYQVCDGYGGLAQASVTFQVAPVGRLPLVWDGNRDISPNYFWSDASNWDPDWQPQSGDSLTFAGTKKLLSYNNISGLSATQITIQDSGFNIGGNGIGLGDGGIHFIGGASAVVGLPMRLSSSATPVEVGGSQLLLSGVLSGSGGIVKSGSGTAVLGGAETYTGPTVVDAGTLSVVGTLATSDVVVNGGVLSGNGRVKSLEVRGGVVSPGDGTGSLTVSNGVILESGLLRLQIDSVSSTDRLVVTGGDVVLGGSLELSAATAFKPGPHQVIVLVNNTGKGSTSGSFTGFADGQVVALNDRLFVVRYGYAFGSDGRPNDVVLVRANANPSAVDDTYVVAMNNAIVADTGGLLANDTDPDGDPVTVSLVQAPAHGTVQIDEDGGFVYTPDANYKGVDDAMIYQVADSFGGVAQAKVTFQVAPLEGQGIRPDVLAWMLNHNPGLSANFLKTELPDKVVLLPNGRRVPIYQIDQFLDVNFRLFFSAWKKEGVNLVETQETHLRKLMALPEFYQWIKRFAPKYNIAGHGWMSSIETYNFLRHLSRRLMVGAKPTIHAPVGGGGGMMAPSWAVWKQMNLFWHEAAHNLGIGHNTIGLSGPLAGELRHWDQQHRWNYETIDINKLDVPAE